MSKHAIIFDTHRFVSRLIETGMAQKTAEALADEQIRLIESNLATKKDIEELRAATKHDIAEIHQKIENLRAEMHRKLAETKADLLKWIIGLMIAQAGVIVALIKLI